MKNDAVIISRARTSDVVDGMAQEPILRTFESTMSLQPVTQKDLLQLPEGMRESAVIKGYTIDELFTVKTSEFKIPDKVIFEGISYQVQTVDNWKATAGYYKILAVRLAQ